MSRFTRQCTFERSPDLAAPEDRADLTLAMAFASDTPYERWWGIEVLDCNPESVRLERLNDGAALLYNHRLDALLGHHVPGSVIADGHAVRGNVVVAWAADEEDLPAGLTVDSSAVVARHSVPDLRVPEDLQDHLTGHPDVAAVDGAPAHEIHGVQDDVRQLIEAQRP